MREMVLKDFSCHFNLRNLRNMSYRSYRIYNNLMFNIQQNPISVAEFQKSYRSDNILSSASWEYFNVLFNFVKHSFPSEEISFDTMSKGSFASLGLPATAGRIWLCNLPWILFCCTTWKPRSISCLLNQDIGEKSKVSRFLSKQGGT